MATKKKSTKPKAPKKEKTLTAVTEKPKAPKRERRSPYELVQALKEAREALVESHAVKLEKLDTRIAGMESKHAERIAVSTMLADKTPEELALELDEMKRQQSLLRRALKKSAVTA